MKSAQWKSGIENRRGGFGTKAPASRLNLLRVFLEYAKALYLLLNKPKCFDNPISCRVHKVHF
jgi:hypothetical protein